MPHKESSEYRLFPLRFVRYGHVVGSSGGVLPEERHEELWDERWQSTTINQT